jgi:hypothetical protein
MIPGAGRPPRKELLVNDKAVRMIVVFGLLATLALTFMMMFTLSQVADTQTPAIALDVSKEFAAALADEPPANVRITMTRDGKGVDAARTYKMVLRPNEKIAADPRSLSTLMKRASECCAAEIGDVKYVVTIRCVAELPGGGEKEETFVKDDVSDPFGFGSVHAVATAPDARPAPAAKAEKR